MDITLTHYLIVCPLVFLAGYIDAVAGGGGLVSLPAYLISGLPAHYAIATNKLSSAMGTTLTTIRYARDGFIPWKQAIFCVIFALIGSSCGAELALSEPIPRMRMTGEEPCSPDEETAWMPATLPRSALVPVEETWLEISVALTSAAEPVKADFFAVP